MVRGVCFLFFLVLRFETEDRGGEGARGGEDTWMRC